MCVLAWTCLIQIDSQHVKPPESYKTFISVQSLIQTHKTFIFGLSLSIECPSLPAPPSLFSRLHANAYCILHGSAANIQPYTAVSSHFGLPRSDYSLVELRQDMYHSIHGLFLFFSVYFWFSKFWNFELFVCFFVACLCVLLEGCSALPCVVCWLKGPSLDITL